MLLCKFSFLVLSHFGSLWSVMSIHLPANQIIIQWKILSVCHSNLCWAVVHCNPVLSKSEYKIIPDPGLVLHGAVNVHFLFTSKNPERNCLRFSDVLGTLCKRSVVFPCRHFLHTEVMYLDAFFSNGFLTKFKGLTKFKLFPSVVPSGKNL